MSETIKTTPIVVHYPSLFTLTALVLTVLNLTNVTHVSWLIILGIFLLPWIFDIVLFVIGFIAAFCGGIILAALEAWNGRKVHAELQEKLKQDKLNPPEKFVGKKRLTH